MATMMKSSGWESWLVSSWAQVPNDAEDQELGEEDALGDGVCAPPTSIQLFVSMC